MPNMSYAYFGDIAGSCTQQGREGAVQILSMNHSVEIPVSVSDASATGTRRHGAMKLVANIDKATPMLMESVCTSKTIPEVKLQFWTITDEGREVNYYNIVMTGVRVVKAQTWYPNVDDEPTQSYKDMMTYELRYNKITWEYTDGNLSFSDEWNAPNV